MRALCLSMAVFALICSACVANDLDDLDKEIEQAFDLQSQGKHKEAEKVLAKVHATLSEKLKEDPENAHATFLLGKTYYGMMRDDKAVEYFEKAAKLGPERGEPPYWKGMTLRAMGRMDEAVKAFAKAIELDGQDREYWGAYAFTLRLAGRPREAAEAFRKAISIDDTSPQLLVDAGMVITNLGETEEGLALFKKALKLDPKNLTALSGAGQACQNLRRHKEALGYFKAAVKADGTLWLARAKVIQEHYVLGEREAAEAAVKDLYDLYEKRTIKELNEANMFCREQFDFEDSKVMVFEYFTLVGERAVKYSFKVLDPESLEEKFRISLGSYEVTTAVMLATGSIKEGERGYSLDGYYPGNAHRTFALLHSEPTYDAVRTMVMEVLEGSRGAISSTEPNPSGEGVTVTIKEQ